MFLRSCVCASLFLNLALLSGTAEASTKNCHYLESAKSIHTRLVNAKLSVKKQSKAFKIITKASACSAVHAAGVLPAVTSFRLIEANSNSAVSAATVVSSNVTLSIPAVFEKSATLEAVLNTDVPYGVRMMVVGVKDAREQGAPFSLFGNEGGDFYGGKMLPGMYKMEIRSCKSSADKVCSTTLFSGTLTLKETHPGEATPVEVSTPTPVPTATATATATPTPPLVPDIKIDTLNVLNGGIITGEAPLSVFVKGITSASDSVNYQKCMDTVVVGFYAPVGDPRRATWEAQGDARKKCFDGIDAEILKASSTALHGHGSLMTAHYAWDFGDSSSSSVFNNIEGWSAAHTYDQPGDYFVALEVTDTQGTRGVKRMRVKVLPSTRRPVYVSEFGNDSNDGTTEKTPIKSIAMISRLTLNKTGIDLLFKKGETFRFTPSDPTIVFNKSNIRVSSYGTAQALPIMLWTGGPARPGQIFFNPNHRASDVTIENLQFDTDLTGVFGDANYHEENNMPVAIGTSGTRILARNNNILNVGYFVSIVPVPACENNVCVTARTMGFLATKNVAPSITGIRGYFIWNGTGHQVNAYGNRVENSLREHILRSAGDFELLNAQFNEFRNTTVGDGNDSRKGVFNCQGGFLSYIAHNLIHEAGSIFAPLGGDRGARGEMFHFGKFTSNKFDPMATNILRTTAKYGDQTAMVIGSGVSHVTIANNMFDFGSSLIDTSLDAAIFVENGSSDYNRHADDVLVAHNTFASGKGALDKRLLSAWDGYTNLRIANNLMVSPDVVGGDFRTTPMSFGTALDGTVSTIPGISQMSCNVIPLPLTYKGRAFDSATNGIIQINNFYPTIAQWNEKFAQRHGINGIADMFQNILVDRIDNTDIPQAAYRTSIQCPPLEGISNDFFGTARKSKTTTAGAYEFPSH